MLLSKVTKQTSSNDFCKNSWNKQVLKMSKLIYKSGHRLTFESSNCPNKAKLSGFVSCRDDFNIQVLHAFVELHEFTDLNLVQALR